MSMNVLKLLAQYSGKAVVLIDRSCIDDLLYAFQDEYISLPGEGLKSMWSKVGRGCVVSVLYVSSILHLKRYCRIITWAGVHAFAG